VRTQTDLNKTDQIPVSCLRDYNNEWHRQKGFAFEQQREFSAMVLD